jgi:hypothetical protein
MTIETKTTIQLSDINAFEFKCKNCNRIVTMPIGNGKNMPANCDCSGPQWMPYGGDTHAGLVGVMNAIARFGQANNEPFSLRLVIDASSDRASSAKD